MNIYLTVAMFFSMLPYIQIFSSASYTQPYYLLIALLGTIPSWLRISHAVPTGVIIFLVGLSTFGVLVVVLSVNFTIGHQELKYLVNYLAPFILFPVFAYGLMYHHQIIKINFVYLAVLWVLVGAVQLYIDPSFATFLLGSHGMVSEIVINSGRGAISLSPEPTHFGLICLLFAVISHFLKLNKLFSIMFLISAIMIARSASALLILICAFLIASLTKARPRFQLVLLTLFSIVSVVLWSMQINPVEHEDSRILNLLLMLFSEEHSVLDDSSVATRLGGLILGSREIIANFGFPFGGSQSIWLGIIEKNDHLNHLSQSGMPSGWGIIIFQLGYMGIVLVCIIFYNIFKYKGKSFIDIFYIYLFILVFAVQFLFTSPLFALCLAVFFVKSHGENVHQNDSEENYIV